MTKLLIKIFHALNYALNRLIWKHVSCLDLDESDIILLDQFSFKHYVQFLDTNGKLDKSEAIS